METAITLILSLLRRLISQKLVDKLAMLALREASKSTENKVDDEICRIVGDALGNPCD